MTEFGGLPRPLWEGVGEGVNGRGAVLAVAPLPLTPSRKGRGRN